MIESPAGERPVTYALDCAATGMDNLALDNRKIMLLSKIESQMLQPVSDLSVFTVLYDRNVSFFKYIQMNSLY
jgi:hypothetical protein